MKTVHLTFYFVSDKSCNMTTYLIMPIKWNKMVLMSQLVSIIHVVHHQPFDLQMKMFSYNYLLESVSYKLYPCSSYPVMGNTYKHSTNMKRNFKSWKLFLITDSNKRAIKPHLYMIGL